MPLTVRLYEQLILIENCHNLGFITKKGQICGAFRLLQVIINQNPKVPLWRQGAMISHILLAKI